MDRKWEAEKYALSKMTMAFLPRRMLVKDAKDGELGYTRAGDAIYIAKEHELFSMLADNEKVFFRKGVFAHEMLHQIFTDFESHKKISLSMSSTNARVFGLIANVLEDPAIEYWSQTKFGGSLLKSLKFSIAHIYKNSPNIEESESAFAQFINALIHFGDMGLVKGHFTFPEAKKVFLEVAPVFNRGILEADGKKRLYLAKQIMEISRPLWEEDAKAQEEFEKMLSDLMEQAGKQEMSGSGSGEKGDSDYLPEGEGAKEKRRTITIKSLDSDDTEEKSSGSAGEIKTSSSTLSSSTSSDEESSSSSTSSSEKEESDKKEKDGKTSSGKEGKEGEEKGEKETSSTSEKEGEGEKEGEISDSLEEELSEEDKKEMESELEKALEEMRKEKEAEKRDDSEIENMDLKCDKLIIPTSKILNQRVKHEESSAAYTSTVTEMSTGIANTTRQLKRMLSIAQDDTEYSTRGKININRLNCGKNTARVFDKKRVPNNIADLIIGIAVDLSGSMCGSNIKAARECCIAIAEICHNLGIPIYIMGYTGDIGEYTVVHRHYVTWKNSKQDRESLTEIHAECENFDGPSFRYFANIMRKKQSKHKLMVVISDGTPAGPGYYGPRANQDTAMAIKEARRVCDVLGVAIGNSSTKILQSFYGNDFMHVSRPSDLFAQLSVKLKKFVQKWTSEE